MTHLSLEEYGVPRAPKAQRRKTVLIRHDPGVWLGARLCLLHFGLLRKFSSSSL